MRKYGYIVGVIGMLLLIFYNIEQHILCNHSYIADLCKAYQERNITGILCHELCVAKAINIHTCLSGQAEKRVHQATWKSQEVILKSMSSPFQYDEHIIEKLTTPGLPYADVIKMEIFQMFGIQAVAKCQKRTDIIDGLMKLADVDKNGELSLVEARSLIEILRVPEAAMLLILNGSTHALNMYGYCGHVYVTEAISVIADETFGVQLSLHDFTLPFVLEPVEEMIRETIARIYETKWIASIADPILLKVKRFCFQYLVQKQVPTLQDRFHFAFSLLDAILDLNSNPFGLLQSCDTHLGNFGVSSNASIAKFIDLDLTFPKYIVQRKLEDTDCDSDSDCSVGDFRECVSSCNVTSGYCNSKLKTQDLHNICVSMLDTFDYSYNSFDSKDEKKFACLTKFINALKLYCLSLPTYETMDELKMQVLKVKERLQYIKDGKYNCP